MGSYNLIITTIVAYTSVRMKTKNRPNSLNDKILKANSIAKISFMVDQNLHCHNLEFRTREVDALLILIILFQL